MWHEVSLSKNISEASKAESLALYVIVLVKSEKYFEHSTLFQGV